MTNSDLKQYLEVLDHFDSAMLVTRRGPELRARPMAIAKRHDDGRLSFLTSVDSGKLEEITDESSVNLSMQEGSRFMSVSGAAMVSREREKIEVLWSPAYQPWFPEGKDHPALAVLQVMPTYAEFWDTSGLQGVKSLFQIGKSVFTGETPEFDSDVHQKIDFPT
jgi:general stress protein 26